MKNFCLDLKKHATKINNYEKKRNYTITNEEKEFHRQQKFVIYAKKYLVMTIITKNIIKSEIIVITQENIEELLMVSAI